MAQVRVEPTACANLFMPCFATAPALRFGAGAGQSDLVRDDKGRALVGQRLLNLRAVVTRVQCGIHNDPAVHKQWRNRKISDDPVVHTNSPGTVTFAHAGPNSRTTQIFINLKDNAATLDKQRFAPFAQVIRAEAAGGPAGADPADPVEIGR